MYNILDNIIKIIMLMVSLSVIIIFYTLWERRFIGFIQDRVGPNRLGPYGLFQPIADTIKLLLKSMIIPNRANKTLFILGPVTTVVAALSLWAVIPINPNIVLSDLDVGLLYLLAIQSIGVNAIIIAGWASNSKYALLGSIRTAAQMISYSIPMGFAVVGVLMKSGSMNLSKIINAQQGGINNWFFIPLLPLLFIYWVCALAETNRLPFDVAEGESELVAGFHIEYSGMSFALFFLAEYSNMILTSILTVIMFFGGWLSPFNHYLLWVPNLCWLFIKAFIFMTIFLWLRATLPRYRYDQIMNLCWKILIPIALIWIIVGIFSDGWLFFSKKSMVII
jgi:NADH-quinone oxidoreductase subunit H